MGFLQAVTNVSEWVWITLLTVAGTVVLVVYLSDRSDWSLLIPAYVFYVLAGMIALIELNILRDESIGTYVLTSIALPFLVVFLRDRTQWWSLIPAYVLMAVGLMVGLIGSGVLTDQLIPSYIVFAIAIPFTVVFALNPSQWWALMLAGAMALIGISLLLAGKAAQYILPITLIIAGAILIVRLFTRSKTAPPDSSSQ